MVTAKLGEQPWGALGNARISPQTCGIADSLRVIYALGPGEIAVTGLRPQAKYHFTLFDPATGERKPPLEIATDADGNCRVSSAPTGHDSVILLELP